MHLSEYYPSCLTKLLAQKKVTPKILLSTFTGNPQATIIGRYSPTNVSEEVETETFYDKLSSITRQIPNHNVLIISGDFNTHFREDNGHKFAYHQ